MGRLIHFSDRRLCARGAWRPRWSIALLVALGIGCGSKEAKSQASGAGESSAPASNSSPPLAALRPLPLGKRELTGYAYILGPGRPAYEKARAAEKVRDWAKMEAACRETLLLDRGHLSASFGLAVALAQQGKLAEVSDPLSAAVAGDFMRWGEQSLTHPALRVFHASGYGERFRALVEQYRAEFHRIVADRFLVVGRRGRPWSPRDTGSAVLNHRSEVYAYNLRTGRYVRASRTNGALVGFVRAPERAEIAYVSYRKVWLPPSTKKPGESERPYMRDVRVGIIDLDTGHMSPREARFEKVSSIDLGYAGGAKRAYPVVRLVVPGKSGSNSYRVDPTTGRLRKIEWPRPMYEVLRVRYRSVERIRPAVPAIAADWSNGAAGALHLEQTRKTLSLQGDETVSRDSLVWSPGQTRLALTTTPGDPCGSDAADRAVKLYVADAATGTLQAIAAGEDDFGAVWVDETRLAFVDSSGAEPSVRLVDVTTGGELVKLNATGGVSTQHLFTRRSCRPPATESDSGPGSLKDDDEDDDEADAADADGGAAAAKALFEAKDSAQPKRK